MMAPHEVHTVRERTYRIDSMIAPNSSRRVLAGLIIVLVLSGCRDKEPIPEPVAFVGCPADGQTGEIAAPQGEPKVVVLDGVSADAVAYYKGEHAPGAFAPSGWHCRVWYGSAGSTLIVTPAPINSSDAATPK